MRVGHGGSDPGVNAEMLVGPEKDVTVILLSNTSLCANDMRSYVAIFLELWKQAQAIKSSQQSQDE